MDILEQIDSYLNEKKELIIMWDEVDKFVKKAKKGKTFAKKETRINKTIAALATEVEPILAKRNQKKVENWVKKKNKEIPTLKNPNDKTAYRWFTSRVDVRDRQQKYWEAEGYEF